MFHKRVVESRYPVVLADFRHAEVLPGCFFPIGPLPVFVTSRLAADPQSYLWVIFATHFAASLAAMIMWEAFSHRRVWCFTPTLVNKILCLPL